jgi:prepilin-type N-terminal cleavage/methylation domain-containing protein
VRRLSRGFTLLELVIALVLLGVIGAIVYPIISGSRRLYRSDTARIDRRQSLRAAVTILSTDLRELDASGGDILAMSPTAITIRGTRQLAFLCAAPPAGLTTVLAVRESPVFGARDFNAATDSLLIYYEGPAERDEWLPARLLSIDGGVCADGTRARDLTVRLATDSVRLLPGAPIRGFEVVSYRLYEGGDGQWQIGMEDGGPGSIQPLVGPVTARGLTLIYRDARGGLTAMPESVATIELGVRVAQDSAIVAIALRNNRER